MMNQPTPSRDGIAVAPTGEHEQTAALVAGHRTAGRLVLQRGVFTGPSTNISDGLYANIKKGTSARQRFAIQLPAGTHLHTNTYFGRFAASYWQRWTTVEQIEVWATVEVAHQARVRLVASDIAGHPRIVDSHTLDAPASARGGQPVPRTITMRAPLDKFLDGGALWIEVDAIGGTVALSDVAWTAPAPTQQRPLSIVTCTCNRADDCATTLATLASDAAVVDLIDTIYVADQGTDLVGSRPLFTQTADQLGDKLRYLRQPNLGGSAGFTRGLFEASAVHDHGDVIIMDDDILCEPETMLRVSAFAHLTTQPTLVGAQMLFLLNPDYLNVGAEEVHLDKLMHGRKVPKALSNTSMLTKNQERRVDAGYNAWWTCLVPIEVVKTIGLPLPFFFQWEDVEYGLRACAAGFPTVTLANAGVWHHDFYWKDFDDWARYFSSRNSLIVGVLHTDLDPTAITRRLFTRIAEYLVAMNYGLAHTTLQGIEDFLQGPHILHDGGAHALQESRSSRADYPETIKHPATSTPGVRSADIRPRRAGGEPSRPTLILCKRAFDQWFGRTEHGVIGITREDAHWWHISRFDHVVVTDASQSGVRIRRRDKQQARKLLMRTARTLYRLRKELPRLQQEYRTAAPRLTSRENWARLYQLSSHEPA